MTHQSGTMGTHMDEFYHDIKSRRHYCGNDLGLLIQAPLECGRKKCHKTPMTGNGSHTTYKNGDDWGMVYVVALPCFTHMISYLKERSFDLFRASSLLGRDFKAIFSFCWIKVQIVYNVVPPSSKLVYKPPYGYINQQHSNTTVV